MYYIKVSTVLKKSCDKLNLENNPKIKWYIILNLKKKINIACTLALFVLDILQ